MESAKLILSSPKTIAIAMAMAAPVPCFSSSASKRKRGGVNMIGRRGMKVVALKQRPAISLDLIPPPIDYDLRSILEDMGAQFSEDGAVSTFGNNDEALEAAETGAAVLDLSHFGRLRVSGDDRIRFLHNQSSADIQSLKEGEGCDTVFLTPTARTIDLATTWIMKNAIILLVSPNTRLGLSEMLNKYIFFADKVMVEDITEKTHFFTIVGPASDEVVSQLNLKDIVGKPYGTHLHYSIEGGPMTIGVGSVLSERGYSLMVSTATAGVVWKELVSAGAVPMGSSCWEQLRIVEGRPAAGKELTDEFNVLEAGLWKTISSTKGCYIGQETVARLITYDGVKQHLWGISLEGPADPGTAITISGTKVGKLTSCTYVKDKEQYFGLGYIKRKAGGRGLQVEVGKVLGTVVDVPFIRQSLKK